MLLVESTEWIPTVHYRRTTHVCRVQTGRVLRPIDADRNLTRGRAQLLVQASVRPYPHVVLGDFHLHRIQPQEPLLPLRLPRPRALALTEVRKPLPGA